MSPKYTKHLIKYNLVLSKEKIKKVQTQFYLKNILRLNNRINLNINDFEITIREIDDLKINEDDSKLGFINSENVILEISSNIKKEEDEYLNLAIDIIRLLSFAIGREIIFDSQNYSGKKKVKKMIRTYNSGFEIIPSLELENYLKQTLKEFVIKSEKFKKSFFIISHFLNQVKLGYIDDRIFRVMQAYEALINYKNIKSQLPQELIELKGEIKKVTKKWLENNENSKLNSRIKIIDRINSVYNNEILILKLKKMISEAKLNKLKLDIDFRELKRLRDQVAHKGFIFIENSNKYIMENNYNLLEAASLGLQLVLLNELKYKGMVTYYENDWKTFGQVSDFFNQ